MALFISLLAIFELFRFGWKFTPFSDRKILYPVTPVIEYLQSQEKPYRTTGSYVIPDNLRSVYRIETVEGYETIHPLRVSEFIAALNSNKTGTTPAGRYGSVNNDTSTLLNLANTKYFITHKVNEKGKPVPDGKINENFLTDRFSKVFEDGSVSVLENKESTPRAFVVYDWEVLADKELILSKLIDDKTEYENKVYLEGENIKLPDGHGEGSNGSVTFTKYEEQESVMNVGTDRDGLLFISDAYYPGWHAYIDGKLTLIYRADFNFRGVFVPAGNHIVRFIYDPLSFKIGLWLSLTVFFVTGSIYCYAKGREKKRSRTS